MQCCIRKYQIIPFFIVQIKGVHYVEIDLPLITVRRNGFHKLLIFLIRLFNLTDSQIKCPDMHIPVFIPHIQCSAAIAAPHIQNFRKAAEVNGIHQFRSLAVLCL